MRTFTKVQNYDISCQENSHTFPTIGYSKNKYWTFFKGLVLIYKPKEIVEIGIGEGYTLSALSAGIKESNFGRIRAYDIFEKWPYFHQADYKILKKRFSRAKGIKIIRGDFFKIHRRFKNDSIDLFNVDIPLDGGVYRFFFKNYLKKLKKTGLAVLEGGSEERDTVHWMSRYNKEPIIPVLKEFSGKIHYFNIEPFPSLSLIRRK